VQINFEEIDNGPHINSILLRKRYLGVEREFNMNISKEKRLVSTGGILFTISLEKEI